MAWEGAFGTVPAEADNCVMSGAFVTYEPDIAQIEPKFLDWYFRTPANWQRVGRQSTGTNVRRQSLDPEQFEATIIPLPPLDEQRRIVARIEALAKKVEEARHLRATAAEEVDAQWPATLRIAFEGRLASANPFRTSALALLKKSELLHGACPANSNNNAYPHAPQTLQSGPYALPQGWCWTTLGSVLTHMVDCVNDTPNFSETDTGLLGLKTTNIRPYRLDLQRRWYMTPDDFASWNRRLSPIAGDIVLTREAPVGNVCMVPEGISVCLTQRLMLLRPENHTIHSRYLLHFLNSPSFTDQIKASGRGQTHPHIRVGDAPHFLLPLPPMEQQITIVAELDALQSKLDAVKALQAETAAELDAMLPAILDKAFKGEL